MLEAVMTRQSAVALLWVPRIAGIAMGLFLGIFALDAFGEGKTLVQAIPAFLIHLVPTFVVLAAVALSWRFPLVGAVAFMGLALAYAISVHWRLDWVAVIGTPLVVIALLFTASWYYRGAQPPPPSRLA
jgi:hypothetical protein